MNPPEPKREEARNKMSLISDAIVSEEELAAIFQILGGSSTAHTPRQQPGPSEAGRTPCKPSQDQGRGQDIRNIPSSVRGWSTALLLLQGGHLTSTCPTPGVQRALSLSPLLLCCKRHPGGGRAGGSWAELTPPLAFCPARSQRPSPCVIPFASFHDPSPGGRVGASSAFPAQV